jgi:hypothetical protein
MSSRRPNPHRILAFGHDAVLLQTRCMVLRNAGFQVNAVNSSEELEAYIAEAKIPYRLILVGHTVPEDDRARIAILAGGLSTLVHQLTELVPPQNLIREVTERLNEATDTEEQI